MFATNSYKYILVIVFGLGLLLGVLLLITPGAIFPDASWGFMVLRSMQQGNAFNTLVSVDPDNVKENYTQFLSWWSPGQYMVPGFFHTVFGLSIGRASAVTVALCQLAGLAGFYAFFKRAGFSNLVATISLLVIVSQQAFILPYIFYNGGETLLFAFLGWFLYGCLVFDKPGIKFALFVLFSGFIGFFCKSSFLWMYAAGLLFIWIRLYHGEKNLVRWILKSLWLGVPALIAVSVIYFFYIAKGDNPSSDSGGLQFTLQAFAFPLASPLLSGFSVDDLFHGLLFHSNTVLVNSATAIAVIAICAVLSLILITAIRKHIPNVNYPLMLIVFYITALMFFGNAYLRQLTISYEARHFRILGVMIVPGVVYLFTIHKPALRYVLTVVVLMIAGISMFYYTNAYKVLRTKCAYGPTGIAQQFIDQQSLNYIVKLDNSSRNALFAFTSPDIGLEVSHNRVINLPTLGNDISIDTEQYTYKGFAGPLYVLLPAKYMGIRASVIMKCFPGYKGFSLKQLSDDYVLYYATQAR